MLGRCSLRAMRPASDHRVRILFAIFVLCIFALAWAIFGMTQRIRQHQIERRQTKDRSQIDS